MRRPVLLTLLAAVLLTAPPAVPLLAQTEEPTPEEMDREADRIGEAAEKAFRATQGAFRKFLNWYGVKKGPIVRTVEKWFVDLFDMFRDLTESALNHMLGKDSRSVEEVFRDNADSHSGSGGDASRTNHAP